MRVIQERDGSNNPLVSYTRGTDLSGSMEGAGGIGGLLARSSGYSSGNLTLTTTISPMATATLLTCLTPAKAWSLANFAACQLLPLLLSVVHLIHLTGNFSWGGTVNVLPPSLAFTRMKMIQR
jgi:hypothetical protein